MSKILSIIGRKKNYWKEKQEREKQNILIPNYESLPHTITNDSFTLHCATLATIYDLACKNYTWIHNS